MSVWNDHVHPHGEIKELSSGLWEVTGSLARNPLPRSMQVWRAPSGELLIHSAICLNEAGMASLEALGPIRWVIIPCGLHRADALPYRERYPQAQFLCPAAARSKVEEVVPVDALCEDVLPALGITIIHPKGLKPFELHLLLPLANHQKALIMTDALFNLEGAPPKGIMGLVLKWIGSVGPLGMTRIGRWLLLEDRALARAYFEELATTPNLSVLCIAHGDSIRENVHEALRAAADRLG